MRIIEGWIEADKAEKAERATIDVTPPPVPEPEPVKTTEPDDDCDGELVS